MDFKRWQSEGEWRTKIEVAEIAAKSALDTAEAKAASDAAQGKAVAEAKAKEPAAPTPNVHVHMPIGKKTITRTGDGVYNVSDA